MGGVIGIGFGGELYPSSARRDARSSNVAHQTSRYLDVDSNLGFRSLGSWLWMQSRRPSLH